MTTENKSIIKNRVTNLHDIDKLTDNYVSFVSDNIPTEKQSYFVDMLYNNINNMYKLLINSAGNKDLEQENDKLRQALKDVEDSIDNASGEISNAESYLISASTTIDNLNLDIIK